jgi:hypothetical protein
MMGVFTFIGLLITGSVFSYGLLLLFRNKKVPGVMLLVLSVICYIAYIYIASTYFA